MDDMIIKCIDIKKNPLDGFLNLIRTFNWFSGGNSSIKSDGGCTFEYRYEILVVTYFGYEKSESVVKKLISAPNCS